MAITAGGVGSGLDVNGIVEQLMALERRPADLLQIKSQGYETQLSAYGRLRSAVSTFQSAMAGLGSADKFNPISASVSDSTVLSVTSDSSAVAGDYDVEITRLAQNHKMESKEFNNDDNVTNKNRNIKINLFGSAESPLQINIKNKTLSEIKDEINSATNNPGVTASLINVTTDSQRLILMAEDSGEAASITIEGNGAGIMGFQTINQDINGDPIGTDELDAEYSINGYSQTSATNNASGVIEGVSLTLKKIGSSTFTLSRNDEAIKESISEFVDAYNALHSAMSSLKEGDLSGDSSLRSIQRQVRNVFDTAPVGLGGAYSALVQVGINSDAKTGSLSLDADELDRALETDFQSVIDLFSDEEQGFAFRLEDIADRLLDNDNVIDGREDGLRDRIDDIDQDLLTWESRLALKETALRAQFAALDSLIGSLQSTSAFLTQQLGQL